MFDRRKAEVLGYVALAFVAVFLVVRLLDHASEPAAAPVSVEGGDGLARSGAAGSESQATSGTPRGSPLVGYVAGEVRRPGVYRVAPGSRAEVVVASAGGLTRHADGTAINLAAPVRDGQQLV